jgi:DNA-binding response OmpR family regulator
VSLSVLIADDAPDVAEVVSFAARLTWPECKVMTARNGEEAALAFRRGNPDVVILDLEMPPPDGYELCRLIREVSNVPVLVLTVRDSTADKVRLLDAGADDYLTKPFDHTELMARLRALVRRAAAPPPARESRAAQATEFAAGDLRVNFVTHEVRVGERGVDLTSTEYRLLEELVKSAGTAISHRTLLERVWGPAYATEVHYLKIFVRRLRQKLGDDAERPRYIQTEWGIGYRFASPRAAGRGAHGGGASPFVTGPLE